MRNGLLATIVMLACGCLPSTRAADPTLPADAPALDAARLAVLTHERLIAARVEAGLPPLAWDAALVPRARQHSEDMARRDFFGHTNPDGQDVNGRAATLGLSCEQREGDVVYRGFGENLFLTFQYAGYETRRSSAGTTVVYDWQSPDALARQAVDEWLKSPGHRRNLLGARYRSHAIGVALGPGRRVYFTDVFC